MEPIEYLLGQVEWQESPETIHDGSLPYATHYGVLSIAGSNLRCYRLNTGERVFDADDIAALFGGEIS